MRSDTALVLALAAAGSLRYAGAAPEAQVDFAREVAPIFEASCVRCHDAEHRKGKFSLATAADMFARRKGHEDAVAPGRPDESLLVDLIVPHGRSEPEMPEEGRPLNAAEAATIRRWIEQGAAWPAGVVIKQRARADKTWWSLQPLRQPGGESIDSLVQARLAEKGLAFNPPAPAGELIRRATYDLTGLPPTPEEITVFEQESAADSEAALRRLIDRLLASPRYGEHWGRHWLDVIRFGESSGFERNLIRDDAWPFRDYVIRSFNEDKPFDRFILEQLAGDQLAPGDPAVEVGTGFLVAGPYDDVGNKDEKAAAQIRANTLDDVVSATGTAFLGLTVNCARCHDHKFDPIPQADYYRLQAAFAGVQQGSRSLTTAAQRQEMAQRRAPLAAKLEETKREIAQLEEKAGAVLQARRAELRARFTRPAVSLRGNEERFPAPVKAQYLRVTLGRARAAGTITVEECEAWTAGDAPQNVALAARGATITATGTRAAETDPGVYRPEHLIDGAYDKPWVASTASTPAQFTIRFAQPELIGRVLWTQDREAARGLRKAVDEYRMEVSLDGEHWQRVADQHDREPLNPERLEEELRFAALDPAERERLELAQPRATGLEAELLEAARLPKAWIGNFKQPAAPAYLMGGGDPQKHGEEIAPASLAVLDRCGGAYRLPVDAPEGERRLALARWLVQPANPLTPRVLANRVWHYHFGTGLVDTPSDFGYMGGRPSHPELLDLLARRLQASGWQLKPLHREIMLSRTYRQASAWRRDAAAVDHEARLLWRFPPRRLSAEELRDTMLAVSGRLDLAQASGPGFRLYRYLNDNVSTYEPMDRFGPETWRRTVFHQAPRAASVDLLSEFDAPDCAFSAPRRAATTTPLQALTLFNHAFTVEMARSMAERLVRDCGSTEPATLAKRAFALAYGRSPSPEEIAAAGAVIGEHGGAVFCRALLNSNEMLYVP